MTCPEFQVQMEKWAEGNLRKDRRKTAGGRWDWAGVSAEDAQLSWPLRWFGGPLRRVGQTFGGA